MTRAAGSRPSHRRQQIWVCAIAGLFLCDFVLCGYLPSQQRLTSLKEAQVQQRRTIDMAAAQSAEIPRLKGRLKSTERLVERFDSYVPPDRALGTFLQRIAAAMIEHDLTDQVILPGKEVEVGDLGCIPIRITCKGALVDVFGFFNKLQTLDRLVRIEKVVLENDPGLTGRLTMQTEALIFYQSKPLKAIGGNEPAGGAHDGT
jgi:Tfp pilus assembly protein PilO